MNRVPRVGWLRRAERWGRFLENALLVLLLAGLVVLASGQILLRNAFSIALPWADGVVRVGVLWIALLGAVAASRDRKHISIEVAARLLPGRWQVPAAALKNVITAAICGAFAWFSFKFVADSHHYGEVLLGDWPAWWFQAILPVGFGLIAYRYAVRAAEVWLEGR